MKKILLSIKPEYAHAIIEGRKKVEYRKIVPKHLDQGIAVIYSSSPEKMVIGEFVFNRIIELPPDELWETTKNLGCVEKSFFDSYFETKRIGFAFEVSKVVKYSTPITLSEMSIKTAPQSWMYLNA